MAGVLALVETAMRLMAVAGGAERTQRAVDSLQVTVVDYFIAGVRGVLLVVQALALGLGLLVSATFFYALLYAAIMPSKLHSQPLYFDFSSRESFGPSTVVDFLAPRTQWSFTDACLAPARRDGSGSRVEPAASYSDSTGAWQPNRHVAVEEAETTGGWLLSFFSWGSSTPRRKRLLKLRQRYSIAVDLELPESEANELLGTFMVEVVLLDEHSTPIARSRRPALLRYQSGLLQGMRTLLLAPLLLGRVVSQSQYIAVEMFDHYEEQQHMPFTRARVSISSRDVRIYSANLGITAQLRGLRYYMFHWFYTTALACILCIAAVEAAALSVLFLASGNDGDEEDGDAAGFHDAHTSSAPAQQLPVATPLRVAPEAKQPGTPQPATPQVRFASPAPAPAPTPAAAVSGAEAEAKRGVSAGKRGSFARQVTQLTVDSIFHALEDKRQRKVDAVEAAKRPTPATPPPEEVQPDAHLDIRADQPGLLKSGASPYRLGAAGTGSDTGNANASLLKGRRRGDDQ